MFRASSGSVWLYTSLNGAFLRSPIYLSSSNLARDLYVSNVCPSLGILTPFFARARARERERERGRERENRQGQNRRGCRKIMTKITKTYTPKTAISAGNEVGND